mgnify:CR=1 FL=1
MLNINIIMSFKTITIKKDVYRELVKVKGSDESFSSLFNRMLSERHPNLKEFYGAWETSKEIEKREDEAMKRFRMDMEESFRKRHESLGQ